jgi:hypothetical protein
VILGPHARRPVVLPTCGWRCAIEGVNRATVFACERNTNGSSNAARLFMRLYRPATLIGLPCLIQKLGM